MEIQRTLQGEFHLCLYSVSYIGMLLSSLFKCQAKIVVINNATK